MSKLVLDATLREKLSGGGSKVTFVDEDGRAVGHYLPDDLYQGILDALAPVGENEHVAAVGEYRDGCHHTSAELLESIQQSSHRWAGQS